MATTFPIPTQSELCTRLEHLVGRPVRSGPGRPVDPDMAVFAVYVDDEGLPVIVCVCEINFAAYAGAALSLIPVNVAQESVLSLTLTDGLLENFTEVANILAGVFNSTETPHVRLGAVETRRSRLAPEVEALIDGAGAGVDYEISVEGYGSGGLSIRSADV